MSNPIDVELILNKIDKAYKEWPQKFEIINNEFIENIQELFHDCIQAMIQLSVSVDDNDQVKKNRLDAERIVSKLKELRDSFGDKWPSNMESFIRDIFDVGSYHIEAAEFFHPVPFYPGDDLLTKLYRWSVYDTNRTIIYRYYLERSEIIPGQPHYVLGKSYPQGRSPIRPYGKNPPDYNIMKNHIIDNLNDQGPTPIISLKISKSES